MVMAGFEDYKGLSLESVAEIITKGTTALQAIQAKYEPNHFGNLAVDDLRTLNECFAELLPVGLADSVQRQVMGVNSPEAYGSTLHYQLAKIQDDIMLYHRQNRLAKS